MLRESQNNNKGFGLIEIVIATAVLTGSLIALISVFLLARNATELASEKLQAGYLLEEGAEALRFLRDSGWDGNIATLAPATDYYLSFDPAASQWAIVALAPPDIEGLFARSFRIENVSRDGSANIEAVYNPANDDPETKKVIVTVSWMHKNQSQAITLENYLTNLFDN